MRETPRGARPSFPPASASSAALVVVDATGEVFGEAPNVAARVQAAAEPGSVLITGSVQRQVAGLFVVEEKGAHELKGVAQPLSLYRVVRASGGGRRGGVRALTSFVGREEDIGTLLRRWDRVRAGEGQFVQIVGEPGLGKSRLVEEFHSRLGETPHTWVEWNSSQLLQNTPLHPVAEWGRARFGGQDVAAERRLADLETTLAQVKLDVQETATLLAPLLDIPLPAERAPNFGPEELRRRQLAAMVALLLAGARTQPVVLAFEDLHWADPTSLDLIQALAERGAHAPLLVVATTRPEFRAPWGMRSHHAVVALAPLDRAEVRRMVGEIAAQHALPQEVVERVSERTGGVPLFVEEVTRLLLERGDTGSQAVPPTLQQSLAARLDRLGKAREVAQIGAVLGRDFVYTLLRDVAEMDEPALQASLDRLAEADLLFVEGAPPEAKYRFKHALIQDAAYESLLKSRRQVLHRRAAERYAARTPSPSDRPSFHRSWPRRSRNRMVGQGRRSGLAPLGVPGSDRASRQGDRYGGQGGGRRSTARSGRTGCLPSTDEVADRLRPGGDVVEGVRRRGNQSRLRARRRARRHERRFFDPLRCCHRSVELGNDPWRTATGARAGFDVRPGSRGGRPRDGSGRSQLRPRLH